MKKYTTVNGQNYYNEASLNEMIELLNRGETIAIYIDCIGHTRTANETAAYIHELRNIYGDALQSDSKTAHTTLYSLKGVSI